MHPAGGKDGVHRLLTLGILFLWVKKLNLNIIIHWLVILSAMIAILQVVQ